MVVYADQFMVVVTLHICNINVMFCSMTSMAYQVALFKNHGKRPYGNVYNFMISGVVEFSELTNPLFYFITFSFYTLSTNVTKTKKNQ